MGILSMLFGGKLPIPNIGKLTNPLRMANDIMNPISPDRVAMADLDAGNIGMKGSALLPKDFLTSQREQSQIRNPLQSVGDGLTKMLGGDPGAGLLDIVHPERAGIRQAARGGDPDASVLDMVGGQQIPPYLPNPTNIFGAAMGDQSTRTHEADSAPNTTGNTWLSHSDAMEKAGIDTSGLPFGLGKIDLFGDKQPIATPLTAPEPNYPGADRQLADTEQDGLQSTLGTGNDSFLGADRPAISFPEGAPDRLGQSNSATQAPAWRPPSPASKMYQEIERRQGKDFRKKAENPDYDPTMPESETNQKFIRGKDYDDDHNFKDVLRSAGLAALKGLATDGIGGGIGGAIAGAVGGAVDRNADEKMGNEIALGRLIPQYKEAYNIEEQKRQNEDQARLRKAQITNAEIQPVLKQGELERKIRKDQMADKYNELRIKLGQQKADDWRWAQEQLDGYRDGTLKVSEERLKQYQRIIEETERNNLRIDADRDRGLDIKQQTVTNTANNNAATQERLGKALQSADDNKKKDLLVKSLERWQKNNPTATPEDAAAAEAAIRKTIYGQ